MNHESCRERLLELVYGELAGREAREVERHLEACEACRAERERLLATRAAMRQLEAPPMPERVDPIVLAAARRAAEAREGGSFAAALRGFGAKLAAGTAVAVLLALVLVNLGRRGEKGPLEMAREASRPEAQQGAEAPPVASIGPQARLEEPGARPPPAPAEEPVARPRRAAPAAPAQAAKGAVRTVPNPPLVASPRVGARPKAEGFGAGEAAPGGGGRGGPAPLAARPSAPAPSAAFEALGDRAPAPPVASPSPPLAAPSEPSGLPAAARDSESASEAKRLERPRAAKAASTPIARGAAGPTTELARDIERRRAAGELSEAVRRFEPCPGGDRRRTAWIDGAQRVRKLVRERADGTRVEEWFDTSGRLREALVHARAGGSPWTRRVVVGEGGARAAEDQGTSGLAPDVPPPPLVERDPSDAFFAGPGCGR